MTKIKKIIQESIAVKTSLLHDDVLIQTVETISQAVVNAFKADHKVWFCGNGGSAADAQHLAAELSGRFYYDRDPLFAEALHVNTSYITAVGNDYGYDEVYARLVRAKGRKGDILFCISTSGNSPNILKAIEVAKSRDIIVVGMTGKTGGKMGAMCDFLLNVPSKDTPRIQESHILLGHIICQLVEERMFPQKS
jgi:D-sedoheptulose 7-phosphate isomerase